jgi:hypothetical protein
MEAKNPFEKVLKARKTITNWIAVTDKKAGVIKCPICKQEKSLQFNQARNGHIHACCKTEGCVRWME